MSNRELIEDIEANFKELEAASKNQIPLLLNTIIRQTGRLYVQEPETQIALSKAMLDIKNMLASEQAYFEIQKKSGTGSEIYGKSFFKSLSLLKEGLFNLYSKIK